MRRIKQHSLTSTESACTRRSYIQRWWRRGSSPRIHDCSAGGRRRRGSVADSATGTPLPGGEVRVLRGGNTFATATTDAFGRYVIHNVPAGHTASRFATWATARRRATSRLGTRPAPTSAYPLPINLSAVEVTSAVPLAVDTRTGNQIFKRTTITGRRPTPRRRSCSSRSWARHARPREKCTSGTARRVHLLRDGSRPLGNLGGPPPPCADDTARYVENTPPPQPPPPPAPAPHNRIEGLPTIPNPPPHALRYINRLHILCRFTGNRVTTTHLFFDFILFLCIF